jgi:diacylglycerol kinase family enzyme
VRALLIVNPFASEVRNERVARVQAQLARHAALETIFTSRRGHAAELARDASAAVDAVVVYSGDGGFNEVLNGLVRDVPVGFVPGGGTNVLTRALGLPRDPVAAAARIGETLAAGRRRRISLGRVNGRRFAFAAGVGLDAELIRRVDSLGRTPTGRRPGDVAFVKQTLRLVAEHRGRFPPLVHVAGVGSAASLFVANADPLTYVGPIGLRFAPNAHFELGLDFTAARPMGPGGLVRFLLALPFGGPFGRDVVVRRDVDRIEVSADGPVPLQADGEDLGDVTHAVFEAERGAVHVLAP